MSSTREVAKAAAEICVSTLEGLGSGVVVGYDAGEPGRCYWEISGKDPQQLVNATVGAIKGLLHSLNEPDRQKAYDALLEGLPGLLSRANEVSP